jgi:hypothetical protein
MTIDRCDLLLMIYGYKINGRLFRVPQGLQKTTLAPAEINGRLFRLPQDLQKTKLAPVGINGRLFRVPMTSNNRNKPGLKWYTGRVKLGDDRRLLDGLLIVFLPFPKIVSSAAAAPDQTLTL